MARQCPDCKTDLRTEELLGVPLDVCPSCAGIFFDDGEMVKLKDLGDDAFAEVDDAVQPEDAMEPSGNDSKRMCPACRVPMQEYVYLYTSTVKLDSCPDCYGTWVENGELKAMREALADAQQQPINESLMRRLEHELVIAHEEEAHRERLARSRRVVNYLRVMNMRRPWPWF